ncbi:MAG: SDR family oxidoreductase [archaeon]
MENKLKDIFNVAEKSVLITGASGFFGRYMSRTFLELGAKVILLSRSDRLTNQIEQYKKEFGDDKAVGFQIDFYEREDTETTLKKIVKEHKIDVLINNAYDLSKRTGFNTPTGRLENSNYEQWKSAFESGIYWAVLTTQIIGEQFKKNKGGSIINVSSMYGIVSPNPRLYEGEDFFNPPTYGVNKSGIIALTKYTASFWGRHGITCNAIVPGPFPNLESKSENSVNEDNDTFLDKLKRNTALNRVGHPNDLRGILIYLASDASSYMTGQTLVIDGGWTIT